MFYSSLSATTARLFGLLCVVIVGASGISTPALACACCDTYRVVGVEDWDVLNVRSGPSARYSIVGELPPGACGLDIIQDRGRWIKVRVGDVVGWVNARYVEYR